MKQLVHVIVTHLVDHENEVEVREVRAESLVLFEVKVAASDFGKLVGRQYEHAKAIRLLVKSAGRKYGLTAHVDILDPKGRRAPDGADGGPKYPSEGP